MIKALINSPTIDMPLLKQGYGLPYIGIAHLIRKDPLNFLTRLANHSDKILSMRHAGQSVFMVNDHEAVEHILIKNSSNYTKGNFYRKLKPVFGKGLPVLEGKEWKHHHKVIQPSFNIRAIENISELSFKLVSDMMEAWQKDPCQAFNLETVMANLTLTIITQSLFGEDIAEYSQTMADSVDTMLAVSEKRVWAFPDLHNTFVSPSYWRFRKAKRTLDKMIYTMIERRKTGDNLKPDLLTTMIVASSKHELTYAELSDEITTLIVTGHESTANVLSWFFYEITRHPDILNRIRSEIDCVLGDRKCKMRDLSSLPITKAALQETLRLYPATWTISRTNINQDEVGGVTIPPNSNMMISPYLIHRNKKYWDNADIFNPDRFLSNKADFIPKGAYIPFAMGRRGCIGEKFAWQEMLTIATEIIRKFNFEIIAGQRIEPVAKISTSSINGIWVRPITI